MIEDGATSASCDAGAARVDTTKSAPIIANLYMLILSELPGNEKRTDEIEPIIPTCRNLLSFTSSPSLLSRLPFPSLAR